MSKIINGYNVPQKGDKKTNIPNWAESLEIILTDLLSKFAVNGSIITSNNQNIDGGNAMSIFALNENIDCGGAE